MLTFSFRHRLVTALFALLGLILAGRSLSLHVFHHDFLQAQGDARLLRLEQLPAHRGRLLDRNGRVIAASTPVVSLWADPGNYRPDATRHRQLAQALGLSPQALAAKIKTNQTRDFVYLRRQVPPEASQWVLGLDIPGVRGRREYRRFYPSGPLLAQTLGFTDIDDRGIEGLELAFDSILTGHPGQRRVIQDRAGKTIADVALYQPPRPGRDIRLSVDREIAYFALQALREGVETTRAKGGSVVVLAAREGEVLAAVNWPGYNPNRREERQGEALRNRAVTDVFEPGSTLKPFTVAAALESGRFGGQATVDTAPGRLSVGRFTVRDSRNHGRLTLARILHKSSNVGAAKLALALEPRELWETLAFAGFGDAPGSGFPGEAAGLLPHYQDWPQATQAALGYGYGLNVSLLQLARAYAALANQGKLPPARFTVSDGQPERLPRAPVMEADTAWRVLHMLEGVVAEQGTAPQARVPGYRVGGKTGTVQKAQAGGYAQDRHAALFVGLAPLPRPRLVVAVYLDEPGGDQYFGGQVAAPVFARVMGHALRLWNVPPEAPAQNVHEPH